MNSSVFLFSPGAFIIIRFLLSGSKDYLSFPLTSSLYSVIFYFPLRQHWPLSENVLDLMPCEVRTKQGCLYQAH